MVSAWDTTAKPKPVLNVENIDTWQERQSEGIDTAITRYFGTADPSSGASWGANQRGAQWYDASVSGVYDEYNPRLKEWVRHNTGASDYAWRPVRTRREFWPDNPPTITMPWATPQVVDQTWATLSLATLINSHQDATFQKALVSEVEIEVTLTEAGTVTPTTAYLELRKKGAASMARRVKCQVSTMPMVETIRLPVDTAEDLEVQLKVGTGAPSLAFVLKLVGLAEAEAV